MFARLRNTLCCSIALVLCPLSFAAASECPGNPTALGTSRIITVRPAASKLVGTIPYQKPLPLRQREVVLTFDNGPMPPYTDIILNVLAAECVKATFFPAGSNVVAMPELVRRVFDEGHGVGTHTFDNLHLGKLKIEQARKEIDLGIAAVTDALGAAREVAPFFRPPFLARAAMPERYLASRGLVAWGIDVDSEDWKDINEEELVAQTIRRLEKAGKGIVLLHDTRPVTARALPLLLAELKRKKFRIVHVVSAPRPAPRTSSVR